MSGVVRMPWPNCPPGGSMVWVSHWILALVCFTAFMLSLTKGRFRLSALFTWVTVASVVLCVAVKVERYEPPVEPVDQPEFPVIALPDIPF